MPTGRSSHASRSETGDTRIRTRDRYNKKEIKEWGPDNKKRGETTEGMPGQKGRGGAKPGRGTITVEGVRSGRPSGVAIRMETSRSPDYHPGLARVLSIPSRRIIEAGTKRDTTVIRRPSLSPNIEQSGASSGDSGARQRTPVGDPLNDEQWSDHLYDPSLH